MKIKTDCRYILWDRPCVFHKETGVECSECRHYKPKGRRILIIKLDAMGDVLRTTSILEGLKKKYPDSFITWITMPASEDLLMNNPYIDKILTHELDIISILQNERFDLVLNPDTSPRSAMLAALAKSRRKFGFTYKDGKVIPLNKEAAYWFGMGVNDRLKKANKRTYQSILLDMFNLPKGKSDITLRLRDSEISFAKEFAERNSLEGAKPIIGLNTSAGLRWQLKSWSVLQTVSLAKLICEKTKAKILLFGGPHERERNKHITSSVGVPVVDTGTENSLREFIALLSLCDLVVVSDSLALHASLALGKKVVALFGPTSSTEIELYERGIHVVSPLDCSCCYKRTCDKKPDCMDSIKPQVVMECIQKLL